MVEPKLYMYTHIYVYIYIHIYLYIYIHIYIYIQHTYIYICNIYIYIYLYVHMYMYAPHLYSHLSTLYFTIMNNQEDLGEDVKASAHSAPRRRVALDWEELPSRKSSGGWRERFGAWGIHIYIYINIHIDR